MAVVSRPLVSASPLVVDIREDGTFEFRFWAWYPVEGALLIEGKDFRKWLNFYAVPGQTTEMVMRADGSVSCASAPSGPFGREAFFGAWGFGALCLPV